MLNAAGAPAWTANGKAICSNGGSQDEPTLVTDGAGGAIFTWSDARAADYDIYAQRVTALGVTLWANNGTLLTGAAQDQYSPWLAPDGAGGAVAVWFDQRFIIGDLYAQRIDGAGLTYWASNGVAVCSAAGSQAFVRTILDGNGGVIAAWRDFRSGETNLYAQRVELRHGYWGRPEPDILSVTDKPNDQGGLVVLDWLASERDALPYQDITHYSIWRAVDAVSAMNDAAASAPVELGRRVELSDVDADFGERAYRVERAAAVDYLWEWVANQIAISAPGYSYLTPTRFDGATHYFQVVAHTAAPTVFFPSPPDSGDSVDNLAPATPLTLSAMRTTGSNVALDWSPSGVAEPDFKEYWIYRAEVPGFPTDPPYFLIATADTLATDPAADPSKGFYYKVVAVDLNDNSSDDSNEAMVNPIPTSVHAPTITSLVLLANVPNPFSGSTELRIGLPSESDVTVEFYDVAGRRVAARTTRLGAGWQRVDFDGRDDAGRLLVSGVYFCRVSAGGSSSTHKMVIQR
jgi:hypothetical protein